MKDINECRQKIDEIDTQIIRLLEKRMNVAIDIGKYKAENNLPIYNENREKIVLQKVSSKVENVAFKQYIEKIYIEIMNESKNLQRSEV